MSHADEYGSSVQHGWHGMRNQVALLGDGKLSKCFGSFSYALRGWCSTLQFRLVPIGSLSSVMHQQFVRLQVFRPGVMQHLAAVCQVAYSTLQVSVLGDVLPLAAANLTEFHHLMVLHCAPSS